MIVDSYSAISKQLNRLICDKYKCDKFQVAKR